MGDSDGLSLRGVRRQLRVVCARVAAGNDADLDATERLLQSMGSELAAQALGSLAPSPQRDFLANLAGLPFASADWCRPSAREVDEALTEEVAAGLRIVRAGGPEAFGSDEAGTKLHAAGRSSGPIDWENLPLAAPEDGRPTPSVYESVVAGAPSRVEVEELSRRHDARRRGADRQPGRSTPISHEGRRRVVPPCSGRARRSPASARRRGSRRCAPVRAGPDDDSGDGEPPPAVRRGRLTDERRKCAPAFAVARPSAARENAR